MTRPFPRVLALVFVALISTHASADGATRNRVSFADNGQRLNQAVGRGVALADFDGDGSLDAVVFNQEGKQGRCRVFVGDGHGRFAADSASFAFDQGMGRPTVHDFDGDGRPDILLGRTILLNGGSGRFTRDDSRFVDADSAVLWQYELADLDQDGRLDVFANAMAGDRGGWRAYLDDGRGHFRHDAPPIGPGMQAAARLGDVNGDGHPDAVISGWRNEEGEACPNRVYLNDGKGRFTDSGQLLDEGTRHSHGLALGDLDRDGDLDIVLVMQAEPFARIYLNDGKGRYTVGRTLGSGGAEKVALADLNGDGALDVFLASMGPNEIWLNDGRGGFTDSGLRLGSEWSWEVAVGDLDRDGLQDLFVVDLAIDRSLPPDQRMQSRCAEVWLNTSRAKPR